jgi:hypothetical protein
MKWAFWRREQRNKELQEEIQAHLLLAQREAMESGVTRTEARHAARREFGNVAVTEEVTRDMWGRHWLFDFLQDMRYAMRSFGQRPGFVAVALLTLALGIGATTVVFSLVSGVLLKPLPYPEPNRLVAVNGHTEGWNTKVNGEQKLAYLDFLDCQRESHSLDMAALVYNDGTLSAPGLPQYVDYYEISPELFSVARVSLAMGRAFLPEEDRTGATPVAILGYSFWQKRFDGRTDVLTRLLASRRPDSSCMETSLKSTPLWGRIQLATCTIAPRNRFMWWAVCGPAPHSHKRRRKLR